MKLTRSIPILIFLYFTSSLVSLGQEERSQLVWKNFQDRYNNFEDVKPSVVNIGDKPVYIFADMKLGIVYDYFELYRFFEDNNNWRRILHAGHSPDKKYREKIMSNLKIDPSEERPLILDDEDWFFMTESDGLQPYGFRDDPSHKGRGRYKLRLHYYVGVNKDRVLLMSESPIFEITQDQRKFLDR